MLRPVRGICLREGFIGPHCSKRKGNRLSIPLPTLCPTCRTRRRLAFRNERVLYRDTCDLCGKDILSIFSPDKTNTVYCHDCWWSDRWDPYQYEREVDLSKGLFAQFSELLRRTPLPALSNSNTENCDYVNQTANIKNCYLAFGTIEAQDCLYGVRIRNDISCLDGLLVEYSELAYECVASTKIYQSQFLHNCSGCSNSFFLYDCNECRDCLFCWNLRNKQYCVENVQLSKEEYLKRQSELFSAKRTYSGLEGLKKKFESLVRAKAIHRATIQRACESSTGDHLHHCRQTFNSYQCGDLDQCANLVFVNRAKDVVDANNSDGTELAYECCTSGVNGYNHLFSIDAWPGNSNILYSYFSPNSKNIFGCASLKRAEYCILNRQYSKDEYEALVPTIVESMRIHGEWGEFFAPSVSPWGYNETCAHEWMGGGKEEMTHLGFNWCDYSAPMASSSRALDAHDLPDSIDEVDDEILKAVIRCSVSGKLFRLTKFELAWYRQEGLPLPRLHPEERNRLRLAKIPPRQLISRRCQGCDKPTITTLPAESGLEVTCTTCYEQAVY